MRLKIGLPTIGGALLNAPILLQFVKWALDWKGRYDSARTLAEGGIFSFPPWVYSVLLVAGILLIWWDTRRTKQEIMIDVSPIAVAAVVSAAFVAAWGWYFYDRAQGPILWNFHSAGTPIAWSSSGDDPIYFSAFQIQGFNRSNDPVTATKAYLQSNITGTEVQLLFGGDIPIEKGVIEPQANFALISVPGPWRNPPEKPDARAIRKEFGSFTFVFQSPQKNYSIRFERNDVDRIIENAGRELMRTPKPTVIPRH